MVPPVAITTYTCDTAASTSTCDMASYAFQKSIAPATYSQALRNSYTGADSELMSCKPSVACSSTWGAGLAVAQVEEMKKAASAVVRILLPSDHLPGGFGWQGQCTGVAVKGSLDASVYILTAAHCLFDHGAANYPSMAYGSYRSAGAPVYVTFSYEKAACGGQMDFSAVWSHTVPAMVVAYNYSLNGWSAPDWNRISGDITDFALLKLTGPLPAGVTPVTYVSRTLTSSDKLFTFSHPSGFDKVGGLLDRGADFVASTGYMYFVGASRRLTEPGSSGGPLFAYDVGSNRVTVLGTQSSATPDSSPTNTCQTPQTLFYARLDGHAAFLKTFLGP